MRSQPVIQAVALYLMAALTVGTASNAPAAEKQLDIRLDPEQGLLEGKMRVRRPAGAAEFRLMDGLRLDEIRHGDRRLEVSRVGADHYRIDVPSYAQPVFIAWSGRLPASAQGLQMGPGSGLLAPGSGWHPTFEWATPFRLSVDAQVPAGQKLVATGSLDGDPQSNAQHYRARYVHPRVDAVALATGPWLERATTVDGVRIQTLFPQSLDAEYGQIYLEHAAHYLRMFSERLGGYPYASFTVAATSAPVGVAYPGFTLLGERVIPLPFIPHTSLAHELMHSWWGVGVRVDDDCGNWSEALTTYMADYYLDEQRGQGRETRYRWLLDLAALAPELDRPLATFRGGNQGAERIIGYNRGALIFRMLQRRIGARAFDAGARLFSRRHMFRRAGWGDLQAAFSEAAGQDLAAFFAAWVRRPGLPELALHSVESRPDGEGWVIGGVVEQVQHAAPWPLDVALVVETANGALRQGVTLDERSKAFRLRVDQRPLAIAADPDYDLLRRLPNPPPILRAVTLHPGTRLMTATAGLEGLVTALLGRRADPAEGFAADRPLVLVGSTADVARWLEDHDIPSPPEPMAGRGHARLWTIPGTRLAVLSADDAEGMRNLVGALRHHGHRSYLVQAENGSTLDAGTWESPDDDLRIALEE